MSLKISVYGLNMKYFPDFISYRLNLKFILLCLFYSIVLMLLLTDNVKKFITTVHRFF